MPQTSTTGISLMLLNRAQINRMKKTTVFFSFCLFTSINMYAQIHIDTSGFVKNNPNIYAVIISKNDSVVYNNYFNGHTEQDLFNDQSLTKSICSLLMGIAVDKGYIKSVDEKLVDIFPALRNDSDKRKQDITIRQVMNQASGLCHEDLNNLGEFLHLPNPADYVLTSPLLTEPGAVFHYSNAASHLLSVILTKATGMDTRSFAGKFLFGPMGITQFDWAKMNDGYYDGSGLLSICLHTRDLVKVGSLLLHNGVYNHKQIVPAKWIAETVRPNVYYKTEWGFDQSTYSLCWYHSNYKGTDITYAMGWGGQFIVVIPSMQAVIAVNQNTADATAVQQSVNFIYHIFPMIFNQLK